jgi:hypothetical protein
LIKLEFSSTSYERSSQIVESLLAKREQGTISLSEEEDLKIFTENKERFEKARESLGEKGRLAYQLWQMASGQRMTGFSEAGEIMIPSIIAISDVYEIEEEERERMLRWILHIDRLAREEIKKREGRE